jgi:predicted transposase YbfD/YdcC
MKAVTATSLSAQLGSIPDPRIERTKQHLLIDILVIAVCAVLAGADDWVAIAEFGRIKQAWFKRFLALPNGIPSHDTFRRVFLLLDAVAFEKAFLQWAQALASLTGRQGVSVDGKTIRRSHDASEDQSAIGMVSAWATANRVVLGQLKVEAKSNEITAIPSLLRLLELKGCIVTIDAIGCQTDIAQTIVARGADYLLAVKGNQAGLYQEIQDLFADAESQQFKGVIHQHCKQTDKGHGRLEIRHCWTIADPDYLQCIRRLAEWPHLQTLVKLDCERRTDTGTTHATRYFISSLPNDAKLALRSARGHWGIENQLHWVLDLAFREDESRLRKGNAAENFAVLRHIALNLLHHDTTTPMGVKNKRLRAGWDNDYLMYLLTH